MVIDPQEKLMKAIHKPDRVIKNTMLMIRCAQAFRMPIIATTQYVKGLGPFVPELAELLSDVDPIDKIEFDGFANRQVRQLVDKLPASIDTFILTGVEAHICIHQTALGAIRAGFKPWIVADAISSRNKHNHKLALSRFLSLGIPVGPAEMAMYEMLGKAGTPQFKELLQYLK